MIGINYLNYLVERGCFNHKQTRILDIGTQNLFGASPHQIESFLKKVSKNTKKEKKEIQELADRSIISPGVETTYISEILENTDVSYESFDVAPGRKTTIFDLNQDSLSEEYQNQFDIVLNFGTTEHVFNQFNAFKIIHQALKKKGFVFHQVPTVGYLDHCYFIYTKKFFLELASANDYKIIDLWITGPQGNDSIGKHFFSTFNKERITRDCDEDAWKKNEIPNGVINVLLKKINNNDFRIGLEIGTSHNSVDSKIASKYKYTAPVEQKQTKTGKFTISGLIKIFRKK